MLYTYQRQYVIYVCDSLSVQELTEIKASNL